MSNKKRCAWSDSSKLMQTYHDQEWGQPVHNDRLLFEFLILEGAQAGLSWSTILKKRRAYKKAYNNFNVSKIAHYTTTKVKQLLNNPGIVRNRLKIQASIINAKAFIKIQKEFGSFDKYVWAFAGGKPIINKWQHLKEIPAVTKESEALSKDLKARGFKFVGSTICYAFMQAVGMVNDHTIDCFKYKIIKN